MLTPNTPNTLLSPCIALEKCTTLLIMPENNTGAELSPAEPKYFNSAKPISIVGILGGELDRTKKELIGQVLQQRKIYRNPTEAAQANARATKIAADFILKNEALNTAKTVPGPKFLAASFFGKQCNNFRQVLNWMLRNKAEVLVAMEDWMDETIEEYSLRGGYRMIPCRSEYADSKIWMVENPFEKLLNNSLDEHHLFFAFSEQHQRLREVHRPQLQSGDRLGLGFT